jgi:hypothetical protein
MLTAGSLNSFSLNVSIMVVVSGLTPPAKKTYFVLAKSQNPIGLPDVKAQCFRIA